MINLTANKRKFSLPQSWGEITFGTYLKLSESDNDINTIQILSGLPVEYIAGNVENYLPYLEWLKVDINSTEWKSKYSVDILTHTLAQLFELEMYVKSNNKIIDAIKIYFVDLKLENEMLIDVVGLANDLFKQLSDFLEKESKHLFFRPTDEQIRAGLNKFNALGRMNTIDSLAGRYNLKYNEVEQLQVNTAFGMMVRIKLENDYQRNYAAIMSEKNKHT